MIRPTAFLLALALAWSPRAGAADDSPSQADIKGAVERGLALARGAAERYPTNRSCFSCHHQTLPLLALTSARTGDPGADEELVRDQAAFTLESFEGKRDAIRAGQGVGGGAMTVGYALWALALAGQTPDATTAALASFLLKTQEADGHWGTGSRPPLEESAVTTTVLSALGLERYAAEADRAAARASIEKAKGWVAAAPVKVQEDRASKLWGLTRLGAPPGEVNAALAALLAAQHPDGGWSAAEGLPSDPYATGQSLARAREAGLAPDHPAYRRGVRHLLDTREADGSWKLVSRSKPFQVDFDNGDPHGKNQFISTPATCWAVVALAGALTAEPLAPAPGDGPVDLLLTGGKIVDGTGNPWFRGALAIRGDRIVAVGKDAEGLPARRVIDATGLVVAPGFIDAHSHSDIPLLRDGAGLSKVTQGVTTEVLGEDTSGGPAKGKRPTQEFARGPTTLRWSTLGGYFDALEESRIAPNVASYVGLGTLLGCVMGDRLDRPSAPELAEVKALLDEAMTDGALGLSTMVAGPRELKVTTDDLVELAQVVARRGGHFSSHIRNEGTEVLAAVDEAIAVGERAGLPVDIIHLKIADQALWGRMGEIVAKVEAARKRGVNVQANVYPYTRGNNDLATIIPPWAHEGGAAALVTRLRDPSLRDRIKAEVRGGLPGWYDHYKAVGGDWSRMLISGKLSPPHAAFQGKTMDVVLAELAKALPDPSKADPLDLFLDFLASEGGAVGTIYAHHTEADMNLALAQPWCSVGSDGSALAVEGPLREGHPHPRSFGTFPRVLGVYVRERGVLRLEDAVRKMTSLNAAKVGIADRGILRPGMYADVTVFNPETVTDRATYLEPFRYSEGIAYVVVNGRLVIDGGKPTAERPGRALRHRATLPNPAASGGV